MTKCDRAGLQIMIGFGLPCEKKNFKKWITKCYGITKLDGLHSDKVQQLHLYTILPLQKEIEPHVFILSLYLVRSRNWIGNFQ